MLASRLSTPNFKQSAGLLRILSRTLGSVSTALLILLLRVENANPATSGNISLQHAAQDELVFIDQALPDLSTLLAGIRPGTEVILLDPNRDGIQQIAEALRGRKGVRALHILSHGQAGSIQLGKSILSLENLPEYASLLSQWKSSLADDAEILIYGCEVAAGLEGRLFIKELAHLTGADIAASTNLTGYAGADADWILEAATGSTATPTIFVEGSVEHRYRHILQVGAKPTLNPTTFVLEDIQVGSNKLSLIGATDKVVLRRVDNPKAEGTCNVVWVVDPSTPSGLGITVMEDALLINPLNPVIKAGTDNIFTNKNSVNLNNIERVDFITPGGITAPSAGLDKIGFLLLDRGGNDPFKIAAITKLDPDPINYVYGSVISVGIATWSPGTLISLTKVHNDKCGDKNLDTNITAFVSNQKLSGVFVSYQDLGISASQTFYGYSVVGNDVVGSIQNFPTFPTNTTDSGPNNGGWDMTAGGGIVAYNPLANNDTATTPQNTPVTISILSNDVGYVSGLDPSTIDLDPSTPGQQTTLTVAGEGTYTVNLSTGEVTFTPNPSFTGTTTPIKYTVADKINS